MCCTDHSISLSNNDAAAAAAAPREDWVNVKWIDRVQNFPAREEKFQAGSGESFDFYRQTKARIIYPFDKRGQFYLQFY